ncbi:MAG TPA: class I SAM-dependent methyltransferase [Bryobacteraceae bacterium]|jgi:2-polyprenyl-3-methyl-5-hydroxy-6-metoxy-1,4-benzoquinol methylase|nr:class I SAM-dependent methyltransferase [Bryobacteraceae bacterium]
MTDTIEALAPGGVMDSFPAQTPLETICVPDTYLQDMWDRAAGWWAQHLREDKNRRLQVFPLVLSLLGDSKGLEILDAGCGEGTFARMLADAGCTVTGVDFSRLLDVAQGYETQEPRGIRYIKANLTDLTKVLPIPESFDAVVCNLVLHCFPRIDTVLRALETQLKPGGSLVVSDLHPDTFPFFSRAWTSCVPAGGNEYRYTLSADCPELTLFLHPTTELEAAFERAGFVCRQRLAPSAPGEWQDAGMPQFLYYRLQRAPVPCLNPSHV